MTRGDPHVKKRPKKARKQRKARLPPPFGERGRYLLVPVELGGQLVSPPRLLLANELGGEEPAWATAQRGQSAPAGRGWTPRPPPARTYPAAAPPAGPGRARAAPRRRRRPTSPWKPRRGRARGERSPGPRGSPAPGRAGCCSAEAKGRSDGAAGGWVPVLCAYRGGRRRQSCPGAPPRANCGSLRCPARGAPCAAPGAGRLLAPLPLAALRSPPLPPLGTVRCRPRGRGAPGWGVSRRGLSFLRSLGKY